MAADTLPTVRTGERSALGRCPQMWWWKYREGLVPHGYSPDALWFGIGVHEALAKWYHKGKKRGPHPAETFADWCGGEIREVRAAYADHDQEWYDEPKYLDAYELGVAMLDAYVQEWGKDPQWDILAVEHPFKVKVHLEGQPIAYFASAWDGVARDLDDGELYLLEHKTASQISLAYLELDDQAGAYWAVATAECRARGWIGPNEKIAGIIYNFLRKSKPDPRPRNAGGAYLNQDGSVSKRQPPPPFVRHVVERSPQELKSQMLRLADQVDIMNGMRAGEIPVTKTVTRDCTWCQFFDLCKLDERGGRAAAEFKRTQFSVRNPYDDWRKSAGHE